MTRNKILNFIIESIQWGDKLGGEQFYSEKALAIKFGTSQSTAKNALNIAEGMGLLSSQKGKQRIVLDFKRNVFITKYFKNNINNKDFLIKRIKQNKIEKNDHDIFENHFNFPLKNIMVIDLTYKNEWIGKFYSSTPHNEFYKCFFNDSLNFLEFLKKTSLIINKINKKTFFGEDENIWTKRYLLNQNEEIIEEGLLIIDPKNYVRERKMEFYYKKTR